MKTSRLILLAVLASLTAQAAYLDKEEQFTNRTVEPVLPPFSTARMFTPQPTPQPGFYPYYGNAPVELLPFRNVKEPQFKYWTTRLPFRGPGRDFPDPPDLKSLKVGLLNPAPQSPESRRGEMNRRGILLAFEEANARRQQGELPFELIEKYDSPQWGSAANITVELYDEGALAIMGTIDGDATHVALRAALKLEIFIVNVSDPDPSLTETQIPWLIRVFPDDRQQAYKLAPLVVHERGCKRIVVLRVNNRPGRVGIKPFMDAVRRLGCPVLQELRYKEGDRQFDKQVAVIKQADPDAVVFWGNPEEIGPAAAQIRAAGVKAQFFGNDRLLDEVFTKAAGHAAEGITVAYFFDTNKTDSAWTDFVKRFEKRFQMRPDIFAAYGYDGARILIDAIRKAGPNRFRIRDVLANLDEFNGVTGHIRFDGRWDNISPMTTATFRNGRWHFEPTATTPVKISQK